MRVVLKGRSFQLSILVLAVVVGALFEALSLGIMFPVLSSFLGGTGGAAARDLIDRSAAVVGFLATSRQIKRGHD